MRGSNMVPILQMRKYSLCKCLFRITSSEVAEQGSDAGPLNSLVGVMTTTWFFLTLNGLIPQSSSLTAWPWLYPEKGLTAQWVLVHGLFYDKGRKRSPDRDHSSGRPGGGSLRGTLLVSSGWIGYITREKYNKTELGKDWMSFLDGFPFFRGLSSWRGTRHHQLTVPTVLMSRGFFFLECEVNETEAPAFKVSVVWLSWSAWQEVIALCQPKCACFISLPK